MERGVINIWLEWWAPHAIHIMVCIGKLTGGRKGGHIGQLRSDVVIFKCELGSIADPCIRQTISFAASWLTLTSCTIHTLGV